MRMYAITNINDKVWSFFDGRWIELSSLFGDSIEQYLICQEDLFNAIMSIKRHEEFAEVYKLREFIITPTRSSEYMTALMLQEKIIKGEL